MQTTVKDGCSSSSSSAEEMESDLEVFPLDVEEDSSSNNSEADERAWGNRKLHFYDANEPSSSDNDFDECEAKELQQKLYSDMKESDFGSHWFDEEEQISTLPANLTEEVEESDQDLFNSFRQHLKWLLQLGMPAVCRYSEKPYTSEGCKYLHCKVHLLFVYSINVLYCLQCKLRSVETTHESTRQLSLLNKLMLQVAPIDSDLEEVMQKVLCFNSRHRDLGVKLDNRLNSNKRASQSALQFYEAAKGRRNKLGSSTEHLADGKISEKGKRPITFQIARNKGILPTRKKEQRNPRVKHRKRYKKALVKMTSQLRPVVAELVQYGGESSGIRSKLARSVTLK